MSVGTEIEDPVALHRAGTGAHKVAGQTRTVGAHPLDETRSASQDFGSGNWGGGLGRALTELVEGWSSQLSALVSDCGDLADRCGGSGLLYQRTETANTQTMRSLSNEPSPFG